MDAINALFTRRSTREFTEQPIESEKLHQILDAAMSGPCCVNARDWSFVVVTEKAKLQKMAEANGEPARPLKKRRRRDPRLRRLGAGFSACQELLNRGWSDCR